MLEKERRRVNKNMRIGLIHTAFIGDIVLCGLLIEALHRAGHQIIFFTKPNTVPIYQHDTRVASVIPLKKSKGLKKLKDFKSLVKQINSVELDVLISPHKSFTTTLCVYLSRVKKTIGFDIASFSKLYKITRPYIREKHECLRYLELLPPEICSPQIKNKLIEIGRPILSYTNAFIEKQLVEFSHIKEQQYAVVAMGSAWKTKEYTPEHFKEICAKLVKEYPNLHLYFTGIARERPNGENLIEALKDYSNRLHNLAGKISLTQLASLIAKSHFVLSNDSSPVHFAGAFNVPNICFFGPTDINLGFKPTSDKSLILAQKTVFGQNLYCQPCGPHGAKKCPEGHHKCMTQLKPSILFPKIKAFLNSL